MKSLNNIRLLPVIGYTFAAVFCCSCGEDIAQGPGDGFCLKGVYESANTKSAPFAEDDAYHIFAYETSHVEASNFSTPYINSPAWEKSGAIAFPPGIETLFAGHTLNFYGVTLGESGDIESSIHDRAFYLEREGDRLKDLRRAKLESMSSVNSGDIVLPFKHTLTRLNFTITRQAVDQLVGATLESVSIWDYPWGNYDIISGEWTDTTDVARTEMSVFTGSKLIYTEDELREDAHKGEDSLPEGCLVFPRGADAGSVHVQVKVRVPNSEDSGVIANEYLLVVDSDINLADIPGGQGLRQNYEYTFSLALVNNNIKIIMVVPAMYDWIEGDIGIDGTIALGQPITFGGVTWADRNLGAESSTYNNVQEWDQMRGYFYQYGRSIPYFVLPTNTKNIGGVDMEYVYTPAYSNSSSSTSFNPYLAGFPLINSTSKQDAIDAVTSYAGSAKYQSGNNWKKTTSTSGSTEIYYTKKWSGNANYPLSFHSSNTVSNLAYEAHEWETSAWSEVTPAEKKRYLIVVGGADDNLPWWTGTRGSKENAPDTWTDKEKNPCPKGWKVPTKDDWAGIMPLSKRTGDITFSNGANNARNAPVDSGSTYDSDAGLNSYYDWDNNGTPTHQFRGNTGNANNTYTYHAFGNKDNWHETAWFNAGYEKIDKSDPEEKERLWWHEVGGKFKISQTNLKEDLGDPSEGYITHYLCVENKHDADYQNVDSPLASMRFYQGTLYAIKCQGTSQAYRLRWRYITLKGGNYVPVSEYNSADKYPVVLEICRYPASSDEELKCPDDLKQWEDWDYPTETMVFPVGGYLYTEAPIMTNNALESNYAAADHDGDGYFYYVRMKHSTSAASRYLMLFRMRRAYGMSIRCVKDNTVTID